MNINTFLETARQRIAEKPADRLSEKARQALERDDCIIDVHTHVFDKRCITIGYLLLKIGKSKLSDFFSFESLGDKDLLINKEEEEIYAMMESGDIDDSVNWEKVEDELESVVEVTSSVEFLSNKIRDAYSIVFRKKNMLEILDFYNTNFSVNTLDEYQNRPMVLGVLMMDLETGWGKAPAKKILDQVNEIKDIAQKRPVLPFLAVDPRRADHADRKENLYSLFLDAFTDPETPFFGVKCYPSLGYLPEDERLDPIFQICEEKNIPVLTHCGGESVSTFEKDIRVKKDGSFQTFRIPGATRIARARYLNDPVLWEPVLKKHKNLRLNLAHFSGNTDWEEYEKSGAHPRIDKIKEMLLNPDWKVFADFSYNVADRKTFNQFQKELDERPDIREKVMFGTDYWVVVPSADLLGMQRQFCRQMDKHMDHLLCKVPRAYLSL